MLADAKTRRDENSEATRLALLAAARELIGAHGYSGTSIEMVAAAARVTTGAIYHHFQSKKELFRAVAEQLQEELLREAASVSGATTWDRLRAGYDRMLERNANPVVHRILFTEAPQVLGTSLWREISLQYTYGALRDLLHALIVKEVVRDFPVRLLARVLMGLLRESSAELAESGGDARVRAQIFELINSVFRAIRTDQVG
jgi:AcrR family transcriptional regulator